MADHLEIKDLTHKDIGRWVWYRPSFGMIERGRIKDWNEHNVFVVYKCDGNWSRFKAYTSNATDPVDLTFIEHEPHCRASEGFMCACVAPDIDLIEKEVS